MMLSLIVVFGVLVCGWADSTQSTGAKSSTPVEEFSANFTNIGNVGGTGATPITIRITRWTPDDEYSMLMKVLAKEGNDAFTRELQRSKTTGSIGVPQNLAYPLLYARQVRGADGGRKIILITDRPMTFQERMGSSISRDYPLTWIEMTLNKEDRGEGYVILAARMKLLGDVLGIEDLSTQPARLTQIRRVSR
jgi:hypothetical protein